MLRREETKTLNVKNAKNANRLNLRNYTFKTDIYSRYSFLYLRPPDVQS